MLLGRGVCFRKGSLGLQDSLQSRWTGRDVVGGSARCWDMEYDTDEADDLASGELLQLYYPATMSLYNKQIIPPL